MEIKIEDGKGKELLENLIKEIKSKTLSVGWFSEDKYQDNTQVAYVASIQEYGVTGRIPARPFMRPTIANKENSWNNIFYRKVKQVFNGKIKYDSALNILGSTIRGDILKTIKNIYSPPLTQSTIVARAHKKGKINDFKALAKPLIDTGVMISTIKYKIEK